MNKVCNYPSTAITFSITGLLVAVWFFFNYSTGLYGLYPKGTVPISCALSAGSGADDDIIFGALYLFVLPLIIRLLRFGKKINTLEIFAIITIDIIFLVLTLSTTCVYWQGTVLEAGNYTVLLIFTMLLIVNLIVLHEAFLRSKRH